MQLLIQIATGAVVGAFAYCFINPLIGWWLERYRGIKTARILALREVGIAAVVGIAAYSAFYIGPMRAGALTKAYDDLCITLKPESLSDALGADYRDSAAGQYFDSAYSANCR